MQVALNGFSFKLFIQWKRSLYLRCLPLVNVYFIVLCVCICTTWTTCELGKWSPFSLSSWMGVCVFLLVIYGVLRVGGRELRSVCTSALSIPSSALSTDAYWQLDWRDIRSVCAHHIWATSFVTLVVFEGWLCVIWK